MKKYLPVIILTLLITVAIFLTVYLVRQRQEVRKKAAPATALSLSPGTISVNEGETFNLDVVMDTGENRVSAAEIHLSFDEELLQTESITPGSFLPSVLLPGSFGPGVASIILDFGVPSEGAEPGVKGSGLLATFTFKALAASAQTQVSFDSSTQVAGIGETGDVLVRTAPATVTVLGAAAPTSTPTPSTGVSTPTPTSTSGPSSTPTPTVADGGVTPVKITSLDAGQTVTVLRPTFSGSAASYAKITITVESPDSLSGTTYADGNGQWSWVPSADLSDGSHTITVLAEDTQGKTSIASFTFIVQAAAAGPTATPTPKPTATATPKVTPTPTISQAAEIVSGSWQQTAILMITGLFLLILGGKFLLTG